MPDSQDDWRPGRLGLPRWFIRVGKASERYNAWVRKSYKTVVAEWLINLSVGLGFASLQTFVGRHKAFFSRLTGNGRLWLVIVLILLAYLLVLLKRHYQSLYGTIEVVFAVVSSWQILGSNQAGGTKLIAIVGGVYVMTRGMTNLSEGMSRRL